MPKLNTQWTPSVMNLAISLVVTASLSGFTHRSYAQTTQTPQTQQAPQTISTVPVRASNEQTQLRVDGVVEAVRFTEISAQVSGGILELPVQAGATIKRGQLLVKIDARAAQQELNASRAQVDAIKANLAVAEKDYDRQKLLFEKNYISQAQLDRALAQFKSIAAQANAQISQAAAVQTQSGFYMITAPFDGYVASMPSAVGQMAVPGKPIMTVYDPKQLRVIVSVPQTRIASLNNDAKLRIEFPSLPDAQRFVKPIAMTVLPISDAATHTVQVRFDLPNNIKNISPGMFARVDLSFSNELSGSAIDSTNRNAATRLFVPTSAIFRRAELYAVYVLNAQGKTLLRQVKPGPVNGLEQEVLSGLSAGELVVRDPRLAATLTTSNANATSANSVSK